MGGRAGTPRLTEFSPPLLSAGLALALQSSLRHGYQVGRAPTVCLSHGAPGLRLYQVRGSLARRYGWAGSVPDRTVNVHSPFPFFSETQNGLQKFRVVRASAQTPEDVGPREAGEPPFPSLRLGPFWMSKTKCTGQLR